MHRSPVTPPFATENKIIWFMFYIRNSARQPVQTRATTQETPPHLAVLINGDHLHKSEFHTNYIRDRLGIQTKTPAAQRATRSAFYPVGLLTFACLCNTSLDKCMTCWPEQELATGWAVRRSNPGGGGGRSEIYRICPDWPCGPLSPL